MKDLFLGMTIGMVAGAMIASSPKAKKVASDVKNKVTDVCGWKLRFERRAAAIRRLRLRLRRINANYFGKNYLWLRLGCGHKFFS